jgi:hypothetical protein
MCLDALQGSCPERSQLIGGLMGNNRASVIVETFGSVGEALPNRLGALETCSTCYLVLGSRPNMQGPTELTSWRGQPRELVRRMVPAFHWRGLEYYMLPTARALCTTTLPVADHA